MRQVMPHRSNIVADPDNCKNFLHKKSRRIIALSERSIGRLDWPAHHPIRVSFAFRHRRFKRDQAAGKAGLRLTSGGNTADNRRERQ